MKDIANAETNEPQVSHALLLTSAPIVRGMVRLFFVFLVARELGPRQFGVYALLLAMVEMLAVASGSGYADYLTREAAKDKRAGWGLAWQLIFLRLALLVPLAAIGLGALRLFGYPRGVIAGAAWLSLSLPARSLSEAVQAVLRGIGRYGAYLLVELAFSGALAGGGVFILGRGGDLGVVIASEIAAAMAAVVASMVFVVMFQSPARIRMNIRELLGKTAIFNIYGFVGNLYDRLDVIILSRLAGDYATGVYSAAYRALGTLQLAPYGVLYSLLPALSRNPDCGGERQRLERAMGFLLSAAFAVVLATLIYAGPAVHLLLGERYADSAAALKILIWAAILRYMNYALNIRLLAYGHERVFVITSLICLGINMIGNLILIPLYSWRAAAAITIVTEAGLLIQNLYWLARRAGVIPKPLGWAQSSLAFIVILVALTMGARIAPPLVVGSLGMICFIAYLYRTGMVGEFTAVWRVGRNSNW